MLDRRSFIQSSAAVIGGSAILPAAARSPAREEAIPAAMVLPARIEPAFICPGFEEARAREVIRFSKDIRLWQEDENPGALVAQIIRDRGLATRRIGIGMDGHESPNLVRGNTLPLAPGLCFSDEPMIAIYGEFGIRLEDCWHMTEKGPVTFTPLSPSIEVPVA